MRSLLRGTASTSGLGGALLWFDAHEVYGIAAIFVCFVAAICSVIAEPAK